MAVSFASLFIAAVVVRAIKYVIKGGQGFYEEDSEEDEDDVRKIVLHGIAAAEGGGKHMIHEAEDGVVHVSTTVLPAVAKAVEDTSSRIIEEAEDGVDNVSVAIDEALDEAEDGVIGVLDAMGI